MSPTKRKTTDSRIPELCHEISKKFAILADLMDETDMPETLVSTLTGLAEDIGATNSKKRRVPKDPLAPHRNLTSYIHFTNEVRPGIVKDSPNIAPRDVARLLGVKWRALSEKQRDKYDKIAKQDFLRYKQEMADYKSGATADSAIVKTEPSTNNSLPSNESDEEDELSSANGDGKGPAFENQKSADNEDDDSDSSDSDSSDSDSSDTSEASDSSDED